MESNLVPVRPALPVAPYLGGKRNLAGRLSRLIATIPHETYVEPFIGMGGVFFRRTVKARAEVINDISGDVTTLFRVLQRHYESFLQEMRWRLSSRAEYERLLREDPTTLTDIERAARFIYLQRLAFGGKVAGRSFGVSKTTSARFDMAKLPGLLADAHERLSGVVIERLPYADLIRRYDGPGTLFYLDPPYWDCERDYGDGVFGRDDFAQLADQLAGIAGRFILSINDTPGAREVFARFAIEEVETTYTISTATTGKGKRAGELIISGLG